MASMSLHADIVVNHVTDDAGLIELCSAIRGASWMGLDTEFIRDSTYYPRLCLIQISADGVLASVDPLAGLDLTPLDELLRDQSITKVLHASRQDFEVIYLNRQLVPAPVFDTQIAAALAGFGDQPGYAKLVEAMLGVRLDKGHTRTDWSRRPLSAEQMDYAIDDVRYLYAIYQGLSERLTANDRHNWLDEDFVALSDPALYRVEATEAWRRVKGTGRLRGSAHLALRALAEWRERTAQAEDRPRGWVLKDDLLVELAQARPTTIEQLGRYRGIGASMLQRHGDAILECLEGSTGGTDLSTPRPAPMTADEEDLLELLQVTTRLRARELGVSAQSLATRKDLTAHIRGDGNGGLQQGWRRAALGEILDDVVAGRRIIRNGANGPELIEVD
jgi:ribonuclease D